jgi:hypothetical protein
MMQRNGFLCFEEFHFQECPWNIRSLCRAGSLITVKYKLDLVGVQEIKWDKGGTEPADDYTFIYGERNENDDLERVFLVHKRIISAIMREEFASDRLSYIW